MCVYIGDFVGLAGELCCECLIFRMGEGEFSFGGFETEGVDLLLHEEVEGLFAPLAEEEEVRGGGGGG